MDPTYGNVPFRDTFWAIPQWAQVVLYVGATLAIAAFVWGVVQRVRLWMGGKPEMRWDRPLTRVGRLITYGLLQARGLSQSYPGIMHPNGFWGFSGLFMGPVPATIYYDVPLPLLGVKILKGSFYLFYELVLDFFGLFFVV